MQHPGCGAEGRLVGDLLHLQLHDGLGQVGGLDLAEARLQVGLLDGRAVVDAVDAVGHRAQAAEGGEDAGQAGVECGQVGPHVARGVPQGGGDLVQRVEDRPGTAAEGRGPDDVDLHLLAIGHGAVDRAGVADVGPRGVEGRGVGVAGEQGPTSVLGVGDLEQSGPGGLDLLRDGLAADLAEGGAGALHGEVPSLADHGRRPLQRSIGRVEPPLGVVQVAQVGVLACQGRACLHGGHHRRR